MLLETWDWSILHKNRPKISAVIITVPIFFCGQDKLLSGKFWAMGRFNLLGGQKNSLLGGQLPTQLTCYLPPCYPHFTREMVTAPLPVFMTYYYIKMPKNAPGKEL